MTAPLRVLILCLVPLGIGAQENPPKAAPAGADSKGGKNAGVEKKGAEAAKKESATPKSADAAATEPKTQRETQSSMDSLFKLIPVDRRHEGVHYPMMDGEKVAAIIDSEFVTRKDENILEFENAVINQLGVRPMTFRFQRAVYNKATDQLMSNLPSTIESETYRIEGDRVNYDRRTGISRIEKVGTNQVRMTVFDLESLEEAPATPAEGGPEGKAVPAPAPAEKSSGNATKAAPGAEATKSNPATPVKDQPAAPPK